MKINGVSKQRDSLVQLAIEAEIVVACNNNFVGMGQRSEKIIEIDDILQIADACQIPGMDEDIAVGDLQVLMIGVGVTNENELHCIDMVFCLVR